MNDKLLNEGKAALEKGKWSQARSTLEKALDKAPSAEGYEELARACWWLNDIPAVLDYRTKAYQLYLDQKDHYGASRNASWLGIDFLELKGEFAVANGWFQLAHHLLEGLAPSRELALIKLLKGRLAFVTENNNENALRLLEESLQLSQQFENGEAVMMAKAITGFILITEGRIRQGMALLDEATLIAVTDEPKDINFTTITCCMLIDACERIRDYERAGQWCRKVREICRRWHFDAMFASCRNLYASVLVWQGDWEKAEAELQAAVKELKTLRPNYVNAAVVRLADLRRKQGKWEETENLLEAAGTHPLKSLHSAALAYDRDDYIAAENFAERYLRQLPAKEKTIRTTGLELLFRIYIKQDKQDEARLILNELKAIAENVNTAPLVAAVKSAEGIFYFAEGKCNVAKQSLEDAIDIFDKNTVPYESARVRLILSEVLIRLTQFQLAEAELNNALKIFMQLGAEKEVEKTKYLQKNMHKMNAALQSLSNSCDFTGRELEVLRLIAEGKNNEEIAEQLFLSVRTIEKHLTNLYLKLGVSGKSARAFAASYAVKHKLIFT